MDKGQFSKRGENKKQALPKHQKPQNEFILENVKKVEKKKTPNTTFFLMDCLKNHFVFFNLTSAQLESIISKMFYCEVKAGDYVFKQGDDATSFFILEKGKLQVIVNGVEKRELKLGEGFGELALLYNAPRSASIKALESGQLWAIDRQTFRTAVEELNVKEFQENKKFLAKVKFCQNLTEEQKEAVASALINLRFKKAQKIVSEGDPGSSFYIIKHGVVGVYKGSKEVRKLNAGDSFGEQALYFTQTRTMTCQAEEEGTICISIGRDVLTQILGDQIQIITFRNVQKWAIEKSGILSNLTKIQIEKLLDTMKICNFRKGDVVFTKGTPQNQKILICIDGGLKKRSGEYIAQKGCVWGEQFTKDAEGSNEDIIIDSDGVLSEITIDKFQEIIGGNVDDMIKKNERSHERRMTHNSLEKFDASALKLKDLLLLKPLGEGQFGHVYLVKPKGTENVFALKCISKQQVSEQTLEKHLLQEKHVMELVNFPLIMQFIRSYKDEHQIYFLLEFIRGMELFDVIREIGLLNTYESQFYIGSMILSLEYLHTYNIIYRDIKPENIMVDSKGIMKLIDMGTAKILEGKRGMGNRTFTIIGTPHYMAPEIITGKGYNMLVDLWSIGVCLYEFMGGKVPFGEDAEDPYEIYEEIIKKPILYPSFFKDRKARKIVDQLVNKVPEIRLGGSYASLKGNPWFDSFDWDKLLDGELKPPFVPPEKKMMSQKEILETANKGVYITEKIQSDIKKQGLSKKVYQTKYPGWDNEF